MPNMKKKNALEFTNRENQDEGAHLDLHCLFSRPSILNVKLF